jgi:pteridine reductase
MTAHTNALDGRWALITGAAKRVGAGIARILHEEGAGIAIHYRSSGGPARELAAELNARRANSAVIVEADLLDVARLPAMLTQIVDQTGRLDMLINNASSFYATPLGTVTEAQWNDLIGTNLKAPLFLSQAAAAHLRASRGVIINMTDIHATRPLRNHVVYGTAKAGLAMLTRSLARDLAPEVRVNAVAPGAVLWPEDVTERTRESILRQIPLRRAGAPEDIARCVLYLVRDAPYVTGQVLAVDGGRSIGW